MLALSLTQPWASLVAEGHKRYETRSWRTSYCGPLAIHASKGFPKWAKEWMATDYDVDKVWKGRSPSDLPRGAVIGTVTLEGCYRPEDISFVLEEDRRHETAFGDWSKGRWIWHFTVPVLFEKTIPATGALGLWRWE